MKVDKRRKYWKGLRELQAGLTLYPRSEGVLIIIQLAGVLYPFYFNDQKLSGYGDMYKKTPVCRVF